MTPGRDRVTVGGRQVAPPQGHTYLLLHKPVDVVTTASDPHGRPTVLGLVPPVPRVFPVGRLDQDSSGALLLTDDGALTHRLLHPRYKVDKEYEVQAEGQVDDEALAALRDGLLLPEETRPTAPAEVEVLRRLPRHTWLRMVIHEGRKRQIRRMLEAVGHPVVELRRVRIGAVALGDLEPGTYRELTPDEVAALRREAEAARPGTRAGKARRRRGRGHGAAGAPAAEAAGGASEARTPPAPGGPGRQGGSDDSR